MAHRLHIHHRHLRCGHAVRAEVLGDALMEWQDIATAPRDGTPILAYRHDHYAKFGHMQVTFWRTPEDKAGYTGWGEFNKHFWPPTHWTPLLAPPVTP